MNKLLRFGALQCLLIVTPGWAQEGAPDAVATHAETSAPVSMPVAEIADRALDTARDAILNLQTSIGYAQARADELVADLKKHGLREMRWQSRT